MAMLSRTLLAFVLAACGPAQAAVTPDSLQRDYEAEARRTTPSSTTSAERGAAFFRATHGNEWRCASCHGDVPTQPGKHARTGKAIAPLAPSAQADRFTDAAKADKWFRRNCGDVAGRECSAQEKADVLAFLRTLR